MKAGHFVILAVISAAIVVGLTLVAQIGGLKSELMALRREVQANRERIPALEKKLADFMSTRPSAGLDRSGGAASDGQAGDTGSAGERTQNLELSRAEIQLIRDYIKVPPPPPGVEPTIMEGGVVSRATLLPLPPQITDRVARLRGARFTTDRNGAIIIIPRGSVRAGAIISPN